MIDQATHANHPEPEAKKSYRSALVSNVAGWPLWFIIGAIALKTGGSEQESLINLLIFVLGSLLGWATGMFIAPLHAGESKKFVSIGQAVSAFVSGYALSKFDRFLELVLFSQSDVFGSSWLRLAIAFSGFLLIAIIVYSSRAYYKPRHDDASTNRAQSEAERSE